MGKRNSKLKPNTLEKLTADTYCKLLLLLPLTELFSSFMVFSSLGERNQAMAQRVPERLSQRPAYGAGLH